MKDKRTPLTAEKEKAERPIYNEEETPSFSAFHHVQPRDRKEYSHLNAVGKEICEMESKGKEITYLAVRRILYLA